MLFVIARRLELFLFCDGISAPYYADKYSYYYDLASVKGYYHLLMLARTLRLQ